MSLSRLLTEIIPIEDLYAAGAEWRDGHGKVLVIIESSSAIISTISSSTLIWMILRSPQRMSTSRHRILFGMAIGDILYSLSIADFRAMTPSDVDYLIWNARGNQATCNVQGFLLIVGVIMSLLYSCSLNIYSLAIVKYNKTDSYIRTKMEPFLHGVPIATALLFSIAQLATQGYNSNGIGSCLEPVYYPPHCIGYEDGQVREGFEIPCGRGRDGPSTIISYTAFFYAVFGSPIIVGVTLWMMHRHVSRQDRRMRRYGAGTQNNSTGRVVMVRARAYTASYLLTWSCYIARVVLRLAGVPTPLAVEYLIAIFTPLQGCWNLMIFMYPKVMKAKRSRGGNLSWCQATTEAFCPAINRWRERRTPSNNEREISQEEEESTEYQPINDSEATQN